MKQENIWDVFLCFIKMVFRLGRKQKNIAIKYKMQFLKIVFYNKVSFNFLFSLLLPPPSFTMFNSESLQ